MVSNWSCISAIQANWYRIDQDQEAARLEREKYNRENLLDTRDAKEGKKKERRNKREKKTTRAYKNATPNKQERNNHSNTHPSLTMTAVVLHGIPPAHEMRRL